MANTSEVNLTPLDEIPASRWERLSTQRIYFGHQSVGFNVLEGVQDILARRPQIGLKVVESDNIATFENPGLVHSRVGLNKDPDSKTTAFASFLNSGAGDRVNAACFKFCYVDVNHDTDVRAAFARYVETMDDLARRFPDLRILHLTVPLTAVPTGPKQTIKRLLGKPHRGIRHNIQRERFNDLMRKRYGSGRSLFDIADVESTRPDGRPVRFSSRGKSVRSMDIAYTPDSGHLNELGRLIVAREFLIWLEKATA